MLEVEEINKLLIDQSNQERVIFLTNLFDSLKTNGMDHQSVIHHIASLYPRYDQQVLDALDKSQLRSEILLSPNELSKEIFSYRKYLIKSLLRRIKTSSQTSKFKKTRISASDSEYRDEVIEILKDIDRVILCSEVLGHGKITKIYKYTLKCGKSVIIKQYKSSSFFYRLSRSFVESRATISWRAAHLFKLFGIPTAAPLGMSEERIGRFLNASYYISEFVCGQIMADFYEENQPQESWNIVSKQIEDILITFPKVFMTHGDFKATNFIIKNNQPVLIDLDSVTLYWNKYLFRRSYTRHINRFEKNWRHSSTAENHFKPFIARIINTIP